jgi:subfamily B ATP-binding cassette protein MsbA
MAVRQLHNQMPEKSHPSAKVLYLRLLRYAWRHWQVFLISVLSLAIYSATNTGFLAAIKMVTDQGFVQQDPEKLGILPFVLFGLLAVRALAGFASYFSMRWVARRVVENVRLDAFSRLMTFPVGFFDANSAGTVTSTLTYNTEQMANASTKVVVSAVRDTLTIVGMIGYMLYLNWHLTMVFAVMAPLIAYYLRIMTPRIRASGKAVQESVGDMTRILEESVGGQRVVKVFGGEEYENQRFARAAGMNRRMQIRLGRISGLNSMVVELIAAAGLSWVVFYSVGKFSAGEFAAFVGAILMLISPVKSLTSLNEEVQVGLAAAQSVFGLMDLPPEENTGEREVKRAW